MTPTGRKKRRQTPQTPIRAALRSDSSLCGHVQVGLDALLDGHRRECFEPTTKLSFADSLDIDEGLKSGHEQENRWDYLLGHKTSGKLVAVETHAAKSGEIGKVIDKRRAAIVQLRGHLRDGLSVAKWLWVASGKVQFAPIEKARFKLSEEGIEFVGKRISLKHLP